MDIIIRTEELQDYPQIAEINELAFYAMVDAAHSSYIPEKVMVALLRHGTLYDPELSLVAEIDSKIVGHALYYPCEVRIEQKPVRAVSLGPIAVHPQFQKRGIGIQLMAEGHRRAAAKGYVFSFLLGHPGYYPKVGYRMGMFGQCQLTVQRQQITGNATGVEARFIQPGDIDAFLAMWENWFRDVDLALRPGNSLVEWVTHIEKIVSYALIYAGDTIGYLRYEKRHPANVKMFLAKDQQATGQLLAYLREQCVNMETQEPRIHLPLHPAAQAVKRYLTVPYEVESETWDAAMIKILDHENASICRYCEEVQQKKRQPGLVIYPPMVEGAL